MKNSELFVEYCRPITYLNKRNWCYNYTSHTGMWQVHLNIDKYKIRKIIAIKNEVRKNYIIHYEW